MDKHPQLKASLAIDRNCHFEFRFHHPAYDLLRNLQSEAAPDRTLTPQTKVSISIALGTDSNTFSS
jgi:hypothetical protein